MSIQSHKQSLLEPTPLSSIAVADDTSQLHARFPRREMQPTMRFARGETLFSLGDAHGLEVDTQDYFLTEGELLIVQDGRPVDLIEAGEWFAPALWDGAQAVAHTDCTVSAVARRAVAAHAPSTTGRMGDFLARLAHALTESPTCQPA